MRLSTRLMGKSLSRGDAGKFLIHRKTAFLSKNRVVRTNQTSLIIGETCGKVNEFSIFFCCPRRCVDIRFPRATIQVNRPERRKEAMAYPEKKW